MNGRKVRIPNKESLSSRTCCAGSTFRDGRSWIFRSARSRHCQACPSGWRRNGHCFLRLPHGCGILQQLVDAGTLFVGQVIGGDMFHAETDSLLQITFPPLVCFAGQSVDEVDAYVVETGTPAVMYGLDGLLCIVAAVQQFQGGIVKVCIPMLIRLKGNCCSMVVYSSVKSSGLASRVISRQCSIP